eukprot:445660-Rhodomonas_salina.1
MSSKSKAFQWPTHYNFPPFFTKQPNPETNTQRIQHWKNLILAFCQHNRIFVLNVREMMENSPLFFNESISRRLQLEDAVEILQYMSGAGLSEWAGADKNRCLIFWRKPVEWADALYAWVDERSALDTVMTLYEIREGEDTENTGGLVDLNSLRLIEPFIFHVNLTCVTPADFHGMDHGLLVKVVQILEKQGRAVMFDAGRNDTADLPQISPLLAAKFGTRRLVGCDASRAYLVDVCCAKQAVWVLMSPCLMLSLRRSPSLAVSAPTADQPQTRASARAAD